MNKAHLVFVCLLLGGCAIDPIDKNYRGADSGDLVFSVDGKANAAQRFVLFYRKVGQESGLAILPYGKIDLDIGILSAPDYDFQGAEVGDVTVSHLQPGNYEIFKYEIHTWNGVADVMQFPRQDFSIPFTISSGKATYIGNFRGVPLVGKNIFGMQVSDSGYFVVSDKHMRDIPVALKHDPKLLPVTLSVFDVTRLRNPALVPAEYR